ncbi:MAG: helix-turn-helix domain-containing protein [Pseudonocardiaceae bacterium]
MDPLGPEFLDSDEVRAAVTALDIGTLYRSANRLGVTQRQIAGLTGQTQSEVCEILNGRQVVNVHVLRRVADGFGIPRARMFLGYGEEEPPVEEVGAEMKRRTLVAAAMGQPLLSPRGEPITLGFPRPTHDPLPKRLGMAHVRAVRTVTEQLVGLTRYCGGQADQFAAAVARYTRWMAVPATDEVKAHLAAALAELHTEAGWACHDSGLDGLGYFTHGLPLAHQAGDPYAIANAAWQAGLTLGRSYPNDALKMFTLGKLRLNGFPPGKPTPATPPPDDPRRPTLANRLTRGTATAYARMGGTDQATHHLAEANDGWEPRDAFERAGADFVTGGIQLDLGRLDAAEQSATRAVRTYGESHRRDRTQAQLLLAEVHVRAGEPQGLILARHAIAEVSTLQSVVARRARLIPLATALEARPGTDTRELARIARQVSETRI